MKYFHRTSVAPDEVVARAAEYFGARFTPVHEGPRRRSFSGGPGNVTVTVEAEGGHYTLVTIATDQPAESEMDKFSKRFLGEVHVMAEPSHRLRGAY